MVLGLLLARRGVRVQVLELHADFERDFRGDTIHPSTMEMLDRIGAAEDLHRLRHGKLRAMRFVTPQRTWRLVQLGRLKTRFPYIMIAPQARFLEFLHERARRYAHFSLVFQATVQELIEEDGVVKGVRYKDARGGVHDVRAPLTVAADGRGSRLARLAGLEPEAQAPEMDVIWLRLPKKVGDLPDEGALYSGDGRFMVVFDRDTEWQAGYVIAKGGYQRLREEGIAQLQRNVARLVPWLADRVAALDDWKKTHMLVGGRGSSPPVAQAGAPLHRRRRPRHVAGGRRRHQLRDRRRRRGRERALGEAARGRARSRSPTWPRSSGGASPWWRRSSAPRPSSRSASSANRCGHQKQFVPPLPIRLILGTPFLRDIPARLVAFGPQPVPAGARGRASAGLAGAQYFRGTNVWSVMGGRT